MGVVDIIETPDNKGCGLIKPHALYSRISVDNMNDELIANIILEMFPVVTEEEMITDYKKHDHSEELFRGTFEYDVAFDTDSVNTSSRMGKAISAETKEDVRLVHVSINERVIGMVTKEVAAEIATFLRSKRYSLMGDSFMSVVDPIETLDLKIYTDGGRLVRALFNAKKLITLLSPISESDPRPLWQALSWEMMLDEGFVEYIDKSEENHDTLIATNLNDMIKIFKTMSEGELENMPFTHCEIKNVLILGMCSSQTPFAEHNQGPRLVYASGMVKQAMAAKYLNDAIRIDTLLHQLAFSNKRIVYTIPLNWMRAEDTTPGLTIDIAILTYGGYGQEDASGLNVTWRDRGWGRSYQTSTFTLNEKKQANNAASELFYKSKSHNTLKRKIQSYDSLDDDGVPYEGVNLTPDDMMLSRVQYIRSGNNANTAIEELLEEEGLSKDKKSSEFKFVDCGAVTLKKNAGTNKRSMITSSLDGAKKARVTTEKTCKIGKGDKLSSSHAQKTTIGEERAEIDMPFTVSGRIVGLIFNTMGIPSRMTVGHVMEPLAGEVCGVIMERMNATPWDMSLKTTLKAYKKAEEIAEKDYDYLRNCGANCTGNIDIATIEDNENRIVEFANVLKHHGFNQWGEEEFMSGETGELLGIQGCKGRKAGMIFRGKMFYYILTHRAEDKLHSRHTGPRHSLTRQPVEGGSKSGGYRLGEMERDCLIVYGASSLLRERHMLVSDKYTTHICSYCGNVCDANLRDQVFYCTVCDSQESCGQSNISYGFKLLMNILKTSSFFPRYVCAKVDMETTDLA